MQIKIFSSANRSCGGRDGLASRLKVTMVVERVKDADQLSPRVRDHNPKECTELHNHPTGQKGRPIYSGNFVFNFVQLAKTVFFWENMSLYSHQSLALSMFMSSSTLLEAAAADKWRG